eukprot:2138080-Prymnesium_polylepis.1
MMLISSWQVNGTVTGNERDRSWRAAAARRQECPAGRCASRLAVLTCLALAVLEALYNLDDVRVFERALDLNLFAQLLHLRALQNLERHSLHGEAAFAATEDALDGR